MKKIYDYKYHQQIIEYFIYNTKHMNCDIKLLSTNVYISNKGTVNNHWQVYTGFLCKSKLNSCVIKNCTRKMKELHI